MAELEQDLVATADSRIGEQGLDDLRGRTERTKAGVEILLQRPRLLAVAGASPVDLADLERELVADLRGHVADRWIHQPRQRDPATEVGRAGRPIPVDRLGLLGGNDAGRELGQQQVASLTCSLLGPFRGEHALPQRDAGPGRPDPVTVRKLVPRKG